MVEAAAQASTEPNEATCQLGEIRQIRSHMNPERVSELHAARRKRLFQMDSVGNLFLSPRVSRLQSMDEDEKQSYLREQALLLAEADEENFAQKNWMIVCAGLRTDTDEGLTSEEAKIRLEEYGFNELPKEKKRNCFFIFLDQLNDLLVIMLIVAAIVAAALSQVAASVAIIVIVLVNAMLGTSQEMSAANALEALSSDEDVRVVDVVRDGKEIVIDTRYLTPGDIILLKSGQKIPADCRVMYAADLTVKEMALTGESRPVKKNADIVANEQKDARKAPDELTIGEGNVGEPTTSVKPFAKSPTIQSKSPGAEPRAEKKEKALVLSNFLYSTCDILTGKCTAVVVKTGVNTYIGRIYDLIASAQKDPSPLKTKLQELGGYLGIASLLISIVVFVIGVSTDPCRGCDHDSDQPAWLQMLLVSVSLTVAAVPESLPVCVTLTLALGRQYMFKKKALVRKLLSVETLGSADIICTDKTGTLTAGVMTAITFVTGFETYKITGSGHELE
eukprot:1336972-Amorphochlora_amoeboformis.AAC.2